MCEFMNDGLSHGVCLPGCRRHERCPKAGDATLPSPSEGLLHQLRLGGRVDPPEGTLAGFLLRAGNLDEVPIQREIVADGVLERSGFRTKICTYIAKSRKSFSYMQQHMLENLTQRL